MKTEGAMQTLDGIPGSTVECQRCQMPLVEAWRSGGQLCCECGLEYELLHPEMRWISDE